MEGSPEFRIMKDKWTAISVDNMRYVLHQRKHVIVFVADMFLLRTTKCVFSAVCMWTLNKRDTKC